MAARVWKAVFLAKHCVPSVIRPFSSFSNTARKFSTASASGVADVEPDGVKFVRLRGIPFQSSKRDVLDFLKDVHIVDGEGGVAYLYNISGRMAGEAVVKVASSSDLEKALLRNNCDMGNRYIEMFVSNASEFGRIKMSPNGPTAQDHSVMMRGLPFHCTEREIYAFFEPLGFEGVKIESRANDDGTAVAKFQTHEQALQAMKFDRRYVGSRYIELRLRSNPGPTELKAKDELLHALRGIETALSTGQLLVGQPNRADVAQAVRDVLKLIG